MRQELSQEGFSEFRYLGQGAQGYVILAKEQSTNRRYAIKGVHVRNDEGDVNLKILEQAEQEVDLLKKCHGSPYVVNLIRKIEGKQFSYLVLTECQGTLQDIFDKNQNGKLNELSIIKYAKDIAEGLLYIHSKQCVVNDLKMDNILIDYNGNAVVSDFGYAQNLTKASGYGMNEQVFYYKQQQQLKILNLTQKVGNAYFMAPECHDPTQFQDYYKEYQKIGVKTQTKPSQRSEACSLGNKIKYTFLIAYLCLIFIGYLIYRMISGNKFSFMLKKHLPLDYEDDTQHFVYKKQIKYIIDGLTKFVPRDRISIKEALILLKGIISHEFNLDEKFNVLLDGDTQEIIKQYSNSIEFVEHFSNKYYPIMQFYKFFNSQLILFKSQNEDSFIQEIAQNIDDEIKKKYLQQEAEIQNYSYQKEMIQQLSDALDIDRKSLNIKEEEIHNLQLELNQQKKKYQQQEVEIQNKRSLEDSNCQYWSQVEKNYLNIHNKEDLIKKLQDELADYKQMLDQSEIKLSEMCDQNEKNQGQLFLFKKMLVQSEFKLSKISDQNQNLQGQLSLYRQMLDQTEIKLVELSDQNDQLKKKGSNIFSFFS